MVCFIINASFVLSLYKRGFFLSNVRLAGKNVRFDFWAQWSRAVLKTAPTKKTGGFEFAGNNKAIIRTHIKSFHVPWLEIRLGEYAFVSSNPTHCAEPVFRAGLCKESCPFRQATKMSSNIRIYLTNLLLSIWMRSFFREERGLCPFLGHY